jgi:hypothetical protein
MLSSCPRHQAHHPSELQARDHQPPPQGRGGKTIGWGVEGGGQGWIIYIYIYRNLPDKYKSKETIEKQFRIKRKPYQNDDTEILNKSPNPKYVYQTFSKKKRDFQTNPQRSVF